MLRFALALTLLACGGCSLLNESSMAKRADTYDPGTEVRIRPDRGEVWAKSTGDDKLVLKDAKFGAQRVGELTVDLKRSPVVLAQGKRAQDATELMAQQILLNEQWRLAAVQLVQELRGMAADLAPLIATVRVTEQQQHDTAQQARLEARLEALERLLSATTRPAGGG